MKLGRHAHALEDQLTGLFLVPSIEEPGGPLWCTDHLLLINGRFSAQFSPLVGHFSLISQQECFQSIQTPQTADMVDRARRGSLGNVYKPSCK